MESIRETIQSLCWSLGEIFSIFNWYGASNIVLYAGTVLFGWLLIKRLKRKKVSIILILILLFNFYSMFTLKGSVRWLCATTGHPVVAYSVKDEKIDVRYVEQYKAYFVNINSGVNDQYGFEIMPLTIEVKQIGFLYFSFLVSA